MHRSPRGPRCRASRLPGLALLLLVACTGAEPPDPVQRVTVSPPSATLASGATQALTATLTGTKGGALAGRPVTWSSGNAALATVSAAGVVTAGRVLGGANESVTITATSEAVSGSATLAVQPVPVAAVAVQGSGTLRPGGTLQLAAAPASATGEPLTGRPATWTTTDAAVATVSAEGVVTAAAYAGPLTREVTVIASVESRSGSVSLAVSPLAVAAVQVAPASVALRLDEVATLTAALRDATGTALTGRTVVWASANPAVATVTQAGLVTGVAVGTTTIVAVSEGQSASATVVVSGRNPPVLAAVSPASVAGGGTLTLTGTGFSATPTANRVTVGGAAAFVLAATATQLTVRVPCVPGGSANVVATVEGAASAPRPVTMVVPRHALAVGEVLLRESADLSACNELAAPGGAARYLVMLYSTATSQNTLIDLQLDGNPGAPAAVRAVAPAAPALLAAPE
ncbi:MAG: Ig-like domain-containing protein, partial [Gemmatimonadetes bacterium]|nr:Ig-like domain-containing protein [Gemmatimonadota bacterium]